MTERNIRSWKDVVAAREAKELTAAEKELIVCCQEGTVCRLNGGELPSESSDDCEVKSDLLRFLITGGDEAAGLHDIGVQLMGDYISGVLNLDFAVAHGQTTMLACYFEEKISAHVAEFQHLNISRSHLKTGIFAQCAQVSQNVFLRKAKADGMIDFRSVEIGGNFEITGAKLTPNAGPALDAENSSVKKNFSLRSTQLTGTASLSGSTIGGQLNCEAFDLGLEKDVAASSKTLNLQDVEAGSFFWRGVKRFEGLLDLNGAIFGDIVDDAESWDKVTFTFLNQMRYDHLSDPLTYRKRLFWVAKDSATTGEFRPQPYQQLAKVYREMGHDSERRLVLLEKERLTSQQRVTDNRAQRAELKKSLAKPFEPDPSQPLLGQQLEQHTHVRTLKNQYRRAWLDLVIMRMWRGFLGATAGYGYAPQRVVYWALGAILFTMCLSAMAMETGGIVPNSDVILVSDLWANLVATEALPTLVWLDGPIGQHCESFFALTYAVDVFIPLVPLEQETAWAPTTATTLGTILWVSNWIVKLMGWIMLGLGAAGMAGVIRRD